MGVVKFSQLYIVPQCRLYQPQPFVHTPEDHQDMFCTLKHVQRGDPRVHPQDDKDLLPRTSARVVKNDN